MNGVAQLSSSPQQRHLQTLQQAERDVLAGKLAQVLVITVARDGPISIHWTGLPIEVLGILEVAKATILSAMQTRTP